MIALSAACGGGIDSAAAVPWVGQTYELTIHNGQDGDRNDWRKPTPDLGTTISGPVVPQFLLGIGAATPGTMTVTLGTAQADTQDPCTGTVVTSFSAQTYPDETIGPLDFPMHLLDPRSGRSVQTTIHDVIFENVLPGSNATDTIGGQGTFDATIDISEIYSLVTMVPNPDKDSVCMTLATFMVPCQICPFNGQPYCLPVEAVGLGATLSPTAVRTIGTPDVSQGCNNQMQ